MATRKKNQTVTYNLESLTSGSIYSAAKDFRRFITLDYNLESYVGVMGVGVIDGWNIKQTGDLKVQILPGDGIINTYYSESPFIVKKRSEMVVGDREITTMYSEVSQPLMNDAQRTQYSAVINAYDPSYIVPDPEENAYVKVVTPSNADNTITFLSDDDTTYIYAKRKYSNPYPPVDDYQLLINALPNEPLETEYDTAEEYWEALRAYFAQLQEIYDYNWQDNTANHFTEVVFETSNRLTFSNDKILIGKIIVRNAAIASIDTSGVRKLKSMESNIADFAERFIVSHRHGGGRSFDPPKVRLETDIRDSVLDTYSIETEKAKYTVLENFKTTTAAGHKHSFTVDANGNGFTLFVIGTESLHSHEITNWILSEVSTEELTAHRHEVSQEDVQNFTWNEDSRYVVYVNGERFGDETSTNIVANPTQKTLTFLEGVNGAFSRYSCSLSAFGQDYTFEAKAMSVFEFMLMLQIDFYSHFGSIFAAIQSDIDSNFDDWDHNRPLDDPFYFFEPDLPDSVIRRERTITLQDGTKVTFNIFKVYETGWCQRSSGFGPLYNQARVAESLLKKVGDTFQFTPNGANNVSIILEEVGTVDEVQLEILGNAEVTGILRPENIIYIHADKIVTGEFEIARIPFVSHVGRILEDCLPIQYSLLSNDGVRYNANSALTEQGLYHYHRLQISLDGDGSASVVRQGNESVYYADDTDGNSYFISHAHSVQDFNVGESDSEGLTEWIKATVDANATSSTHTHEIVTPVRGNAKLVYSIKEDAEGHLYAGTSDGIMMIPAYPSYKFVMNGYKMYFFGNDLWDLFQKARSEYERDLGVTFVMTEDIYREQIDDAEENLVSDGDSALIVGEVQNEQATDKTLIERVSYFPFQGFKYITQKKNSEVLETETVLITIQETGDDGQVVDTGEVIVERDFADTPVWSLETISETSESAAYVSAVDYTDLFALGSNLITKKRNAPDDPNGLWDFVSYPFFVGTVRDIQKTFDGNIWVATNGGLLVSRDYMEGEIFNFVGNPVGNPDIRSVAEGNYGEVFVCSSSGIFKSVDGGKTWSNVFDIDKRGGFLLMGRDYSSQKSSTYNGHYHLIDIDTDGNGFLEVSVGSGTKHVHQIVGGEILETLGHTHAISLSLWAVDSDKGLWKSIDGNGSTWTSAGRLPSGEYGIVFSAFNYFFASGVEGLYRSSDGETWSSVVDGLYYSYNWNYDNDAVYVGGNNAIYKIDSSATTLTHTLDGLPSAIVLESGEKKHYGYAYTNNDLQFHFNEVYIPTEMTVLLDYNRWFAEEGSWSNNVTYNVYIDNKKVLSTRYAQDRREELGQTFVVNPLGGEITFQFETTISKAAEIGDKTLSLVKTTGLVDGDVVVVEIPSTEETTAVDVENTEAVLRRAMVNSKIQTRFYGYVQSASEATAVLYNPVDVAIPSGAKVSKLAALDGESEIKIDIYESLLSNIGVFTHDELEDAYSLSSDWRPYKFNDTHLSNLLQLTQAVRYVYPDINDDFINSVFYDFRYSDATHVNPLFPDISTGIDLVTTEIYSQKIYEDDFIIKKAKSVNEVLIGYSSFSNYVFVATDIGIFWAEKSENLENDWHYISQVPYPTYDLIIFNRDTLYAATSAGTFSSTDGMNWTLESSPGISFPSTVISLRWQGESLVTIQPQNARFTSDAPSSQGLIDANNGTPYSSLEANRAIQIYGTTVNDGNYVIKRVDDSGNGYGSRLVVDRVFSGPDGVYAPTIVMGSWWNQWDIDTNLLNQNITNTMVVGGTNNVSVNDGGVWINSNTPQLSFVARSLISTSIGSTLLYADGASSTSSNYLMQSTDIGKNFSTLQNFTPVYGTVQSKIVTNSGNAKIVVEYTDVQFIGNGSFKNLDIGFYLENAQNIVFSTDVVVNELRNGQQELIVYGDSDFITTNTNFIIYPIKMTSMVEAGNGLLLFGTDNGLYDDDRTVIRNNRPMGIVNSVGINGIVQDIDLNGTITSIDNSSISGNSLISYETNSEVSGDSLIDQTLYVVDLDEVVSYRVLGNTSAFVTGDYNITIEGQIPSDYIGKRFRVVGGNSVLTVNYDLPIANGELNNQILYISSEEYGNYGTAYDIVENVEDTIIIRGAIVPVSSRASLFTEENLNVQIGQRIRIAKTSTELTLWVTMDQIFRDNSLVDNYLGVLGTDSLAVGLSNTDAQIVSNARNRIDLKFSSSTVQNVPVALTFDQGDNVEIYGVIIKPLDTFVGRKTIFESDHNHDVDLIGDYVEGRIGGFANKTTALVDILVSESDLFGSTIVQKRGDLFENARIVFTNDESYNLRFETTVVSHDANSIKVQINDPDNWNFSAIDNEKISVGWRWTIEAFSYGYTTGITYKNFIVLGKKIAEKVTRGDTIITLEDTIGISANNTIRIQDDTFTGLIYVVDSVLDSTRIQLKSEVERTYFLEENPEIKVLRDTFSNTHEHQIRNNEAESLSIQAYIDNGYSITHRHRIIPLLEEVSDAKREGTVNYCIGSSSIIYKTEDYGVTWEEKIDLNDYREGSEKIEGLSSLDIDNGSLLVGTKNGNIFVEI